MLQPYDMIEWIDKLRFIYHLSYSKVKASDPTNFIIKLSIAAPQCSIANWDRRGNGLRSKTHERALVQAPARLRANVPSN